MSEVRKSPNQPQGPAFESKPAPESKPEKPVLSASKASKASKPASVTVPTKLTSKGQPAQCQVTRRGAQCSNPARHQHKAGWSCTTHAKVIARGKTLTFARAALKPYDRTLWGVAKESLAK